MNPKPEQVLFSLILKTLVLSQIQDCVCQLNPQYETCAAPVQCGKIGRMEYPFWGNNRSVSCGHPGFELDCRNSVPLITIVSIPYRVLDIDKETYSLKVAREDVWNNTCHGTLPNTTLDFSIFSFSSTSNDLNISLSYGCSDVSSLPQPPSSSQTPVDHRFGCKRYGWYMVSTPEEAVDTVKAFKCLSSILVPLNQTAASILATPFMSIAAMEDALGSGFLIQWSANNSNCQDCEESGGVCGYDQNSSSFTCYCSDRTYPLTCNGHGSGSSNGLSNMKRLLIGLLVSGSVGIVALLMLILYVRRRLHSRCEKSNEITNQNVENFLLNHGSLSPKRYSYYEIKKITNSFSDELGRGGYGCVYKGMLPKPDGRFVAVKLLTNPMGDGEEFVNEVSSISKTSHINIVNLLGYCYEKNKRALVYEFMPNKSLDKFIYDDISLSKLGWERRYKIAIGVARGLQYLHQGCNTRIVHFDIKPQNILLDEDFCPKISDFGLAKLCRKKQSILSMLGTRGTIGYIAPEVFSRNFGGVSHKSDVYSYGMLVLEMAGSRNIVGLGSTQSNESYFPDEIYKHVTIHKATNLDDIEIADDEEITMKMLLVALWCIQTVPSDRPSISKVVEMLEGSLKHIQIPPKPLLSTPEPSSRGSTSLEWPNTETENSVES